MTLRKDEIGALIQKARVAQRERRWKEAENAWRRVLAASPRDSAARGGLGTLLLAIGRVAEARLVSDALLHDAPNDLGALTLAARIAADDGDWGVAAQHWRAALAVRPDAPVALAGLSNALLAANDWAGADEWAAKLALRFSDQPTAVAFTARIAVGRGDRDGALRLWREAANRFPKNTLVRRELCRALTDMHLFDEAEIHAHAIVEMNREEGLPELANVVARRSPHADPTAFWKAACAEFPKNLAFTRRLAASALKAGNADDAIAAVNVVLDSGDVSITDAGLIVGVANVHAARGDMKALHGVIRKYLALLRGTPAYRLAQLRFVHIVAAYFGNPETRRRLPVRERTRRAVLCAPLRAKPAALLARSIALEERLAAEAPALLDTDVSHAECVAFVRHVRERVSHKEPFSFVRVNDGEANALPYEPGYASHFDSDAAEREQVWWNRTMPIAERRTMTAKVSEAIWNADAIGIPTFARILRDVHLASNDDFTARRTGRGLVAGVAAFERWRELRPAGLAAPLFASANIQQDLQRWNVYGELFDGIGEVVLVSGHRNLPDAMKQLFRIDLAAFIPVPPGDASLHLRVHGDTRVLPDVLDDVVAQVEASAAGRTVIVGAGYLGKWIVHRSRHAGGIALDLGSALDYWVGLKTRSYQDLA